MMRCRKRGKTICVLVAAGAMLLMIGLSCLFHAEQANAATETALSNKPWSEIKPIIQQRIGTGYNEAGKCTGYVYWCLANAYGVDWGDNSPVEGLEKKLVAAGITKVAEGTTGNLTSDIKPGDIVIFSEGSDRTHCAIIGEGGVLYHARSSVGVVADPTLKEWMSWPDEDKNCDKYIIYRGLQSTGSLVLQKASSNGDMTDGNRCYSLAGAKYGLYQGTTLIGTLTTNADGRASLEQIPYGSYTLKELSPAKGYSLDVTAYNITIASAVNRKNVKETPQANPVDMIIHKIDGEIHEVWSPDNRGQFAATMEGAEYTVNYYDGYYDENTDFTAMIPLRSWVVETDVSGQASLSEEQLVSGDSFYYGSDGQVVLPLGTVTVQEKKAPVGYVLDDTIHVRQISSSGTEELIEVYQIPTHVEQIIRGDIELIKVKDGTMERLANVPFALTSKSTGQTFTMMTDINGYASTAAVWNSHKQDTNGGNEMAGVWFGNLEKVNDDLGALPYDTYVLDEKPCAANEGLTLISGVEVKVYRHNTTINLGTVTDDVILIETSASDQASGKKETDAGADMVLVDRVNYEGLSLGREYVLEGTVYSKNTAKPLVIDGQTVTSEVTFTPEAADGFIDISFSFDGSQLGGEALVIYERLYTDGMLAAVHEDINNSNQTVYINEPVVVESVDTGEPSLWRYAALINLMLLSAIGICATMVTATKGKRGNR